MPYRTYNKQDPWAEGASTLASALFPGPEQQIAMHGAALGRRGAEQDININRRGAELADALGDSVRNNDLREMMALSANSGHQHMGQAGGFGAALMGLPDSGFTDEEQFRMLAAAGNRLDDRSAVSIPHQLASAERNHGYSMAQEGMKERGRMARYEPESTAAQRNMAYRVDQRMGMPEMSPEERAAWNAELGDVSTRTNDVTGMDVRVNRHTGTVEPLQWEEGSLDGMNQIHDWAGGQSQYDSLPMQGESGFKGNLMQKVNEVAGGLGLNEPWPDVANYYQAARRLANESAIQWAAEVNSRAALGLVQMFKQLTLDPDIWLQGNEQAVRSLGDIHTRTERELSQLRSFYEAEAHMLPAGERRELLSEHRALSNMLADTGDLMQVFSSGGPAPQEAAPGPGRGMQEMMQGPAEQEAPPRAVNPQTGETVIFINGQWVPE